ncbi:hypothetical protein GCM10022232_26160 [Streptomyces plumbiresistens]|uniref:Uncharacterized protein n=1 Tax=Streptomyces plumbiresistens TaxID=511811 RepID=A0ABP7R1W0_9ACTN
MAPFLTDRQNQKTPGDATGRTGVAAAVGEGEGAGRAALGSLRGSIMLNTG